MKKHNCETCNYSTNRFYDFNNHCATKRHVKLSDPIDKVNECLPKKKFLCSHCGKEITRKYNMKKHLNKCQVKKKIDNGLTLFQGKMSTSDINENPNTSDRDYKKLYQGQINVNIKLMNENIKLAEELLKEKSERIKQYQEGMKQLGIYNN